MHVAVTYGILYALAAWYAFLVVIAEVVRARRIAMPRQLRDALAGTGGVVIACSTGVFLFGLIVALLAGHQASVSALANRIMAWSVCVCIACVVLSRLALLRAAAYGIED